jgi:hypothetical protein
MAATIVGTVGKHGVLGTVTNLIVTSYSVKKGFELKNLLKDQNGITVGVRYDGKQRTMDIEGTVLTADMPDQGAKIAFTIQTDVGSGSGTYTVTGMLEDVTESGRNGDYVTFKATVAQWDSIASYAPPTPPPGA